MEINLNVPNGIGMPYTEKYSSNNSDDSGFISFGNKTEKTQEDMSFMEKCALGALVIGAAYMLDSGEKQEYKTEGSETARPKGYRYIEDEKAAQEKIKRSIFSDGADCAAADARIDALNAKQKDQDKLADITSEGRYINFTLHLKEGDSPYIEREGGRLKISADNFKKIFDIKDGALKDYNYDKLKFSWADDNGKALRDFTKAPLYDGGTYTVPSSCINKGSKINLDDYME